MSKKWRLLNLGEIPSIRTQAIYHALGLTLSPQENILILTWPDKPFISVGLHQILNLSVELKYAQRKDLSVVRRSCGGGSVYLDSNQLFYQMICDKNEYSKNLIDFYQYFLNPVVETYKYFKVPAEYSPINDIIANKRKISGNGAVSINNAKILVGNFIFDFPSQEMSKILKVSDEKFRDKIANTLEERMGSLKLFLDVPPSKEEVSNKFIEKFSEILDIELVEDTLTEKEIEKILEIEDFYRQKEWLYYVEHKGDEIFQQKIQSGTYFLQTEKKFRGGLLQLFLHFENEKIKEIVLSGDFSITPPFVLSKIQQGLIDVKPKKELIYSTLEKIFQENSVDLPGITIADITELIVNSYKELKK